MTYFVTGATGFIGRHLLECLLKRGATVHCLVRRSSVHKLQGIALSLQAESGRILPVIGDLDQPALGLDAGVIDELHGKVDHFFHVAALYDMNADSEALALANVEGTRHALEVAELIEAGCFHHVSSIAVAGHYEGTFTEAMFEEAERLDDPYACTKHDAEALVRNGYPRPYRIYRPGVVVGHSETGEIDKVDGPYYFFRMIQRLRTSIPDWLPRIGIDGGSVNIVPVDFVAQALDHIAHVKDLDGRTFHLTNPERMTVGEVIDVFCRAARAPTFSVHVPVPALHGRMAGLLQTLERVPTVRRISDELLGELGLPKHALGYAGHPTDYDCTETLGALDGSGIEVPSLESYAGRLWDFWELNLAAAPSRNPRLARTIEGKRVLITGASAGIGRATALRLAASGARVCLVARTSERLEALRDEIARIGGQAWLYPTDLARPEQCDDLVERVIAEHEGVDILINNAGRSIRRSLELSYERFHDFERTMQLNYLGAVKLILGFLPGMRQRREGHILNVSSIGVQMNAPRYSAYAASKAALDTFSMCASPELVDDHVTITTIHMPLVRTDMIAPTEIYRGLRPISPERAAGMICDAILRRPRRVSTWLGVTSQLTHTAAPGIYDNMTAMLYRLFPDSAAAKGEEQSDSDTEPA